MLDDKYFIKISKFTQQIQDKMIKKKFKIDLKFMIKALETYLKLFNGLFENYVENSVTNSKSVNSFTGFVNLLDLFCVFSYTHYKIDTKQFRILSKNVENYYDKDIKRTTVADIHDFIKTTMIPILNILQNYN